MSILHHSSFAPYMEQPLLIPLVDEPEVMEPVTISEMGMSLAAMLIPFQPDGLHCAYYTVIEYGHSAEEIRIEPSEPLLLHLYRCSHQITEPKAFVVLGAAEFDC